jgi:hypothetical protein
MTFSIVAPHVFIIILVFNNTGSSIETAWAFSTSASTATTAIPVSDSCVTLSTSVHLIWNIVSLFSLSNSKVSTRWPPSPLNPGAIECDSNSINSYLSLSLIGIHYFTAACCLVVAFLTQGVTSLPVESQADSPNLVTYIVYTSLTPYEGRSVTCILWKLK